MLAKSKLPHRDSAIVNAPVEAEGELPRYNQYGRDKPLEGLGT